MSKPLTLLNREDKGDVDPGSRDFFAETPSARFPSYFGDFDIFNLFLLLRAGAQLSQRRTGSKREFPLITAFMAIV